MPEPTSTKPYLMRAIYEWCVDNGLTPYLSVFVDAQTRVPAEYVRDGQIVLNIGPLATSRLQMGNDIIECTARFSGTARELSIPVAAVAAIYARENGHGMSFEVEEAGGRPQGEARPPGASAGTDPSPEPPAPASPPRGKASLRRIK